MRNFGFWHICTINHYYEIISEQLDLLFKSDLYEKSEAIFVGVLGDEIQKVEELFKPYPKIKILSHSKELKNFEFLTLKILREKSKTEKPFYGYYFHTKGVSYPGNVGGNHWRNYMNHYLITKWQDNVAKLDEGFETCGVKYIDKGFPPHYSGNFFWFKSEYAKNLAALSKVNNKDRYAAEMWLCSNNPKAACLCDNFVDYNTTKPFDPNIIFENSARIVGRKPDKMMAEIAKEAARTYPNDRGFKSELVAEKIVHDAVFGNWSSILEQFDKTPEVNKIIEKLDRMEMITKEVVEDFVKCKRTNTQEVFETLGMLFKNDSGYHMKK